MKHTYIHRVYLYHFFQKEILLFLVASATFRETWLCVSHHLLNLKKSYFKLVYYFHSLSVSNVCTIHNFVVSSLKSIKRLSCHSLFFNSVDRSWCTLLTPCKLYSIFYWKVVNRTWYGTRVRYGTQKVEKCVFFCYCCTVRTVRYRDHTRTVLKIPPWFLPKMAQ